MGKSTDATILDILFGHTTMQKNLSVAERKIEMPFQRLHDITLFLGWAGANMITDKMGNTMIDPASVTDSVLTMVWSLFSLFPAVIAFLLMVLAWKFPIRK